MFLNTRFLSRRGLAAALTATAAALATAGVAWSATAATTATATTTTTTRASAGPRTCGLNDLYLSMGRKEGAAGSLYWSIRFTNTSTSECGLRGYPGISVLDTAHRQIGPAATRTSRSYATVPLAPGHSVSAVIRTANGPIGGPCLRTGTYLRIYPPASYSATLVPAPWTTCSHTFHVGPVNTEGTI
ncbi:hypothetical protein AQI88_33520 [Streptomyces cellostaticus]|uniref:DUF4232 domain-containing protein n=1 Tax=Streptomyces cellostaticus TaxID=67285 RepID=A0A117PUB3_9ACTN|nr:DUF4232 domain-containing protein [Streptomyces cellostaticus]KUM92107.1 hypothetical protein AQI88_33520 [Streptomyces cellostaticus]GHI07907.1 hypothetical protein Scel_62280 [Streptomyces cellostaticus]